MEASMGEKRELFNEIIRLKAETDTVILAHYYQDDEVQDTADFIGDSLDLAKKAQQTTQKRILFAGVHFMAETAKILNPDKTVLIPDMKAGCSLADACPADEFKTFIKSHPDHKVLSYINCSAEVKALSDVIVTSSNAVSIVNSFPKDQKIIFAPDKYLGEWVAKETGRDLVLWHGTCIVHELFDLDKLLEMKKQYPKAKVVAHPECPKRILDKADFVGSTKKILDFVGSDPAKQFIVVTEPGILYQMVKNEPDKEFHAALKDDCSCNACPYMRMNTLEKIHSALLSNSPQIKMDAIVMEGAKRSLLNMLNRS